MTVNSKTIRLAALMAFATPLAAQDYATPLSEAALRDLLPFGPEATLKLAECGEKTYPTCTYVWGLPDEDDEVRIKLGGKPSGDTLMTIFAQVSRPQDFEPVLSSYKDAIDIDGLGKTAVWSDRRGQLSLLTQDNLVIHVNVQIADWDDPKTTAMDVAAYLLAEH